MKRSFFLAGFSVFSVQCSARNGAGFPGYFTRPRPLASPLVAGSLHRAPRSLPCRRAAFTLIELLVVIAIIAILAALTLSTLGYVNRKGAESRARAEVAALSAAIDSYKLDFGGYPASQTNLYRELTGQGTVNTNKVYFEPTPGMATNNKFVDPWGADYNYVTNATFNVGFFDLWSTAGNAAATNTANWIRN
jgi:general secretion pathway protein G